MGDVDEIVETGEQADFGEFADPAEEGECDVGVAKLDSRIQPTQKVAVGAGDLWFL